MFQLGLSVPPRAGSDVHTAKIVAELQNHGHEVQYLCWDPDLNGPLPFSVEQVKPADEIEASRWLPAGPVFRNLMRYWATSPGRLKGAYDAARRSGFDVLIASGIHGLLLLHLFKDRPTIWYAGDELVVGGLSQLRWANSWQHNKAILRQAARVLFFTCMSRNVPAETWVVAERDARSMRRITARNNVVVIANGVDLEHFRPSGDSPRPNAAVFWGRLDFGPNEQATEFLTQRVWPLVLEAEPSAELTIMGFSPTDRVRQMASAPGVRLLSDAPDIRPVVCSAPVALYPFQSGTGIKNKLLEGAALERALLVSSTAVEGLVPTDPLPWRLCRGPEQWRDELLQLWRAPEQARELGRAARAWVSVRHSWASAGELADQSLRRVLRQQT